MTESRDRAGLEAAEDRLQAAVAANDASALAAVLHDMLVATAPGGRLVGKDEDVAGYASRTFEVSWFRQVRRCVVLHGGTGITAVRARVGGRAGAERFDVLMDYTRTWVHEDGRWQVIAAHISPATEQQPAPP